MRIFLWLLVPVLAVAALLACNPRENPSFQFVMKRPGPAGSGERVLVFSREPVAAPGFRAAAEAYAAQWQPKDNAKVADVAIHFYASLPAAQIGNEYEAALTYCMYQDGAPPAWMTGGGDCFSKRKT